MELWLEEDWAAHQLRAADVTNSVAALALREQDLKRWEDRINQEAANVAAANEWVAAAQKEASDKIASMVEASAVAAEARVVEAKAHGNDCKPP